jgi:prepilin peptidase CpaA
VLEYPLLLVFPVAMAFAAAFDLFTMTIPNRISLALVGSFALVAPLLGLDLHTIALHFATGFGVLVVGFVLFTRGWLGGGDAKLLAAAALWLGFDSLLNFLVVVGLLGGVLSLVILAYRRLVPDAFVFGPPWLVRLHAKDSGVPYGIAIGGAALFMYPETRWFTALIT